jgi:hypothetical protein
MVQSSLVKYLRSQILGKRETRQPEASGPASILICEHY